MSRGVAVALWTVCAGGAVWAYCSAALVAGVVRGQSLEDGDNRQGANAPQDPPPRAGGAR